MCWKPKLIFTDLDGTLLQEDKHLSQRNRRALELAHQGGAQVIVATGRFFEGVPQELKDLDFLRYFILMNGAKGYDRVAEQELYTAEIEMEVAQRVFQIVQNYECTVDCYQKDQGYMPRQCYEQLDRYIQQEEIYRLVRRNRTPLEDFAREVARQGDTVQKIQCFFADLQVRTRLVQQLSQEVPQLIASTSLPNNLELNAERATKGDALQAICDHLGVSVKDTVAFGDGTNDLTMLQRAGLGVAMENGHPDALAAAGAIAPRYDADGVAVVLEQWFH